MKIYQSYIKAQAWLWGALGLFGLSVAYVNPWREGVVSDDWCYALTVKHLVETGTYKLNEWSSANILFQAYWGSLFAEVLGYSYASLRVSTVVLAFVGIIAFYFLAKEHRFSNTQAGLLTLGWLSSPIVLLLTFSFMTDVPFLVLMLVALAFYARAIRINNYPLMFCGSLATVAASLIRPTGLALVAGLFCAWIFSKERKSQRGLYLTGLSLPALVGIFVAANFLQPSISARYNSIGQAEYFANPALALGDTLLWRPATFLHYLAFFVLPLAIIGLIALYSEIKQLFRLKAKDKSAHLKLRLLGIVTGFLLIALIYGFFTKPSIALPFYGWQLNTLIQGQWSGRILITVFTLLGAIMLGYVFLRRIVDWKTLPPQERLLDYVTLFLLMYHLLFFQISDRYLLVLLPYCLIALGRYLDKWLLRLKVAALVSCLAMLLFSLVWVRSSMAQIEAHWKAAEQVIAMGVPTNQIGVSWTWLAYHNFADYLAEVKPTILQPLDFSERWYPEQLLRAPFVVIEDEIMPPEEKWQLLFEVSYKDGLFRDRQVKVLKRG